MTDTGAQIWKWGAHSAGFLAVALLTSCEGREHPGPQAAASPPPVSAAIAPPSQPVSLALACASGVNAGMLADVARLQELRRACDQELVSATHGLPVSETGRDAIFASMMAYRFAPYGQSRATTFESLLQEKQLDCDNYVLLAGYLLEKLKPGVSLEYVGFDGGAVGNHAEAFYMDEAGAVFLDPTVGVAATVSFNDLLMGRTENARVIVDGRTPEPVIESLRTKVIGAVSAGGYRPSDLLYYFANRDEMLRFSDHTGPYWNGDLSLLASHYPTPGSAGLKKNLGIE